MGHKLPASTVLVASLRTCDEGMDDGLSRWIDLSRNSKCDPPSTSKRETRSYTSHH